MKSNLIALLLLIFSCSAFADLKASNRTTVAGQTSNSAVLMKAGNIRSEVGFAPGVSIVTIQDCAGRRLIQINDRTKTYLITPLAGDDQQEGSNAGGTSGTTTLNINEQDTGERKQFFGYTARRIKGTIRAEGGVDSCSGKFHLTTDGWYIDLPAMPSCAPPEREMLRSRLQSHGCNDRVSLKTSGVEKLGYPVMLDTTIDEKGSSVSVHQETTGLSSATLDPALFEIPAAYTQVQTYQELMGLRSMANSPIGMPAPPATATKVPAAGEGPNPATGTAEKNKGSLRIGITRITSSVDQDIAVEGWQQELSNDINFLGGHAVILSADPNDRETAMEQGKEQGCEYVVFTNVSNFKSVSVGQRLGSVLNRGGLGGVGGSGQGRVEIGVQVKVFQPDNYTPVLDGSDDFRQNDADATAKGLIHMEARDVMLHIKKLQTPK